MTQASTHNDRVAPIFILADDDRDACRQMMSMSTSDWFYVPVFEPRHVVQYARQFATTAVFMADRINFPEGGSEGLLKRLLDEVGKPVVVLVEDWTPESVEKWKALGASSCVPHPTRTGQRMKKLRDVMRHMALVHLGGRPLDPPDSPEGDESPSPPGGKTHRSKE